MNQQLQAIIDDGLLNQGKNSVSQKVQVLNQISGRALEIVNGLFRGLESQAEGFRRRGLQQAEKGSLEQMQKLKEKQADIINSILITKLPNQDPFVHEGGSINTSTFRATNGFAKRVFYVSNQAESSFNLENETSEQVPLYTINKAEYQSNPYRLDSDFVIFRR